MDNFYTKLKQNLDSIDYLKDNINDFNFLSDNDIKLLFNDDEISFDFKQILAELCYNRINTLPFDIFKDVISYVENPQLFITYYGSKIEDFSYEQLTSFIYSGYIDADCLIEITKMSGFKANLLKEKKYNLGIKLQCFYMLTELHLSDGNVNELNSIGIEISSLLKKSLGVSEELEMVIDAYLSEIIEKNEDISFNDNINNIGLSMMNYYITNHKQFSDKLIEFYILFRLKDLNCQSYCENLIVSEQNSSVFGGYQGSTKSLTIYSNYLKKLYEPIFKEYKYDNENDNSDFLNLLMLNMISHELGHIVVQKKLEEFQKEDNSYEKLVHDLTLYYWYKNNVLHFFLGDDKYHQYHGSFIGEVRADLFSIFDSSIQVNRYFKNSFSKELLQQASRSKATDIINFYTQKTDIGIRIMTPIQKFDNFFNQYIKSEEMFPMCSNLEVSFDQDNILSNLMLGDKIPEYLLIGIKKIASGEVTTTDIYAETLAIINSKETYVGKNGKIAK